MVDDPSMYFWRCATETELKERGFKSSNQLERLKSMLKDPPQKVSLKKQGMCEIMGNFTIVPEGGTKVLNTFNKEMFPINHILTVTSLH